MTMRIAQAAQPLRQPSGGWSGQKGTNPSSTTITPSLPTRWSVLNVCLLRGMSFLSSTTHLSPLSCSPPLSSPVFSFPFGLLFFLSFPRKPRLLSSCTPSLFYLINKTGSSLTFSKKKIIVLARHKCTNILILNSTLKFYINNPLSITYSAGF